MKKRMCTYFVLCGVLSSSLVMFGMEDQQKIQQLTKNNSGSSSPRSESVLHEILDGIKTAENVIYTTTNPLVEAVVENAELGAELATVVGANKDKANYITENKVVAIAVLVDKGQDALHDVIQNLGKSHDALRKSHDSHDDK